MKSFFTFLFVFPLFMWSQTDFSKFVKLYEAGKYNQAKIGFEFFLKEDPTHLKTLEYLGDIAGHQKLWDSAIGYYQKLKRLKPTDSNYFFKYGFALGMKAKNSNKFKALGMIGEVKESFEKSIKLNPKHIESHWALIMLYLELPVVVGGSETKAIKYSNELLTISPVDGYLSRGQIEEHYNRYNAAEQQYKKAITAGSIKTGTQMLNNLYTNKMHKSSKKN